MLEKAIELFVDIAKQEEDCDAILEKLRSLNSCGDVSDEEYNYIIDKWDDILKEHGLM